MREAMAERSLSWSQWQYLLKASSGLTLKDLPQESLHTGVAYGVLKQGTSLTLNG